MRWMSIFQDDDRRDSPLLFGRYVNANCRLVVVQLLQHKYVDVNRSLQNRHGKPAVALLSTDQGRTCRAAIVRRRKGPVQNIGRCEATTERSVPIRYEGINSRGKAEPQITLTLYLGRESMQDSSLDWSTIIANSRNRKDDACSHSILCSFLQPRTHNFSRKELLKTQTRYQATDVAILL